MVVRSLFGIGVVMMASGCGEGAADPEQRPEAGAAESEQRPEAGDGTGDSPECLVIDETNSRLLALPHTTSASPSAARVDEKDGVSLTLTSSTKGGARLEIWFERCLDLTAFNGIGFHGSGGDVEFGLASPSNSRAPHGSCVGEFCYAASASGFLEWPSSAVFNSWSSFENGSPSAHADPRHVLGVSWTKGAAAGPVELQIDSVSVYSPY